jgi:hypothetical protein
MKPADRSGLGWSLTVLSLALCSVFVYSRQQLSAADSSSVALSKLERGFQNPPDDARVMMRWWWFGPQVTKAELERELRLMKEGGIGGVEIQPVYPLALDDDKQITPPFLSDEFLDALRFANLKAHELGLRVDLTLGSGWPYGGPMVPVTQAAGRLRVERVKATSRRTPIPALSEGERLLAVFLASVKGREIEAESLREITKLRDGAAWLADNPQVQHEVIFFIASRTGQQVKRAAIGGEGYVIDHYDRAALDSYLKNVGDRLLQAFDGKPPYSIFCDSLEVFGSDWTSDFLAEFERRRGYDLKPLLPALIADPGPQTSAIRHDWGQTLTELLNERFMIPMRDYAHRHQTRFRIQGYGIPPATISSNAYADLSEGEGSQWKVVRAARWASSASHLFGREITSSETWTWLHSPAFRATPLDVKAEADLHFLQGVNQLIGHGWPYTAPGVEYPGWRFYAAGVFNEQNPWWIVMPDLTRYLQRVSYLLRQGQPANDVALYLPNHDAWASFTSGKVHYLIDTLRDRVGPDALPAILEAGFNLDFFDDDALKNLGRVEPGALALGASKYKAVVLPNVEQIPPETLARLEEFVRSGGTLIATRRIPTITPGLRASVTEQRQLRAITQRLFGSESAAAHFIRDEKTELGRLLASLVQPDVALTPAVADIGFVHRRAGDAEIYFIANTSNQRQQTQATFRVKDRTAEWWNPFTGATESAEIRERTGSGVTLTLSLEPYESRVVVFTKRRLSTTVAKRSAASQSIDLSRNWQVSFGDQTGVVMMERLRSWSDDEGTRWFSGVATYEKTVNVPDSLPGSGRPLLLDFGEALPLSAQPLRHGMRAWLDPPVREAAVVYLNDRRIGSLWRPPYALDVTGLFRKGDNRLRIVVGNTAINHLAGRRRPDYKLLNLRYGERFQPQDMENLQPLPSGLLGPVRLVAQ